MSKFYQIRYNPNEDYYEILGLSPLATTAEINRAFRHRAKEVHPDLNPERYGWAHQQFQQINYIHSVLTDTVLRSQYDTQRNSYLNGKITSPVDENQYKSKPRSFWYSQPWYTWPIIHGIWIILVITFFIIIAARSINNSRNKATFSPLTANDINDMLSKQATPFGIEACNSPEAQITSPTNNQTVHQPFSIRGTAAGADFASYILILGNYEQINVSPGYTLNIHTFTEHINHSVQDGTLFDKNDPSSGKFESLPPGYYWLMLEVQAQNNTFQECSIQIVIK